MPRNQRGDILLEALIGVLITGIVGAGMAQVASRIAVSRYDAKVESLAVEQMRELLQSKGVALCTLPAADRQFTLPGGTVVRPQVACQDAAPVEVKLGAATGAPKVDVAATEVPLKVTLSVAAADLGLRGGDDQADLVVGTHQVVTRSDGS